VHVTPTQEVQTGVVELQLSFLPWGSDAANARRACLSEFRSALSALRMQANRTATGRNTASIRCSMVETCFKRVGFDCIIQAFSSVLQSSSTRKKTSGK
jgi:hypothetical protein